MKQHIKITCLRQIYMMDVILRTYVKLDISWTFAHSECVCEHYAPITIKTFKLQIEASCVFAI